MPSQLQPSASSSSGGKSTSSTGPFKKLLASVTEVRDALKEKIEALRSKSSKESSGVSKQQQRCNSSNSQPVLRTDDRQNAQGAAGKNNRLYASEPPRGASPVHRTTTTTTVGDHGSVVLQMIDDDDDDAAFAGRRREGSAHNRPHQQDGGGGYCLISLLNQHEPSQSSFDSSSSTTTLGGGGTTEDLTFAARDGSRDGRGQHVRNWAVWDTRRHLSKPLPLHGSGIRVKKNPSHPNAGGGQSNTPSASSRRSRRDHTPALSVRRVAPPPPLSSVAECSKTMKSQPSRLQDASGLVASSSSRFDTIEDDDDDEDEDEESESASSITDNSTFDSPPLSTLGPVEVLASDHPAEVDGDVAVASAAQQQPLVDPGLLAGWDGLVGPGNLLRILSKPDQQLVALKMTLHEAMSYSWQWQQQHLQWCPPNPLSATAASGDDVSAPQVAAAVADPQQLTEWAYFEFLCTWKALLSDIIEHLRNAYEQQQQQPQQWTTTLQDVLQALHTLELFQRVSTHQSDVRCMQRLWHEYAVSYQNYCAEMMQLSFAAQQHQQLQHMYAVPSSAQTENEKEGANNHQNGAAAVYVDVDDDDNNERLADEGDAHAPFESMEASYVQSPRTALSENSSIGYAPGQSLPSTSALDATTSTAISAATAAAMSSILTTSATDVKKNGSHNNRNHYRNSVSSRGSDDAAAVATSELSSVASTSRTASRLEASSVPPSEIAPEEDGAVGVDEAFDVADWSPTNLEEVAPEGGALVEVQSKSAVSVPTVPTATPYVMYVPCSQPPPSPPTFADVPSYKKKHQHQHHHHHRRRGQPSQLQAQDLWLPLVWAHAVNPRRRAVVATNRRKMRLHSMIQANHNMGLV